MNLPFGELCLDAATVTGILDRMEKNGLLERVYSRQNRRNVCIHLLDRGWALREPVEQTVSRANDELVAGFEEAELATLSALLKRLDQNVKTSPLSAVSEKA